MKRVVLLIALSLVAAACGGGGGSTETASPAIRQLAAPDVEAQPTTTLAPLERIVLGEQIPDLEMPAAGTTFDPNGPLGRGDDCAAFFESLLDEALWESLDEPERFATMVRSLGGQATDLADDLSDAYQEPVDTAELRGVFELVESLTLRQCGAPGVGAMFTIGQASIFERFCGIVTDDTEGDPCADLPPVVFPTSFPCLASSGVSWEKAIAVGDNPWEPVDCENGEAVAYSPNDGTWSEPLVSAQEKFEAVDEALGS